MSGVDPSFKCVEKNRSCFHIWRIENMKVVTVPKDQFGTFYKGDSYIILSIKDIKGRLDSHIHFWLGAETTADEAGVAAYKSVELDDYLGGSPVQHREVQEHESKLFLNYFKPKGVRYENGGVKSGFSHVEKAHKPKLLKIKGKQHVRTTEVEISWSSFNHGDVFILDVGAMIFVWLGKDASRTEKLKGFEQARYYRDERKTCNIISVEDGKEDAMTKDELMAFEKHLPLSEKCIKSKEEDDTDESFEKKAATEIKLFVCSDDGGTLKVAEVKTGPLSYKDLNPSDAFIIDNGSNGIWTWIGKTASKKERKEAMRNAVGFIKKKNLDTNTQVTRVIDGGETNDFKCLFRDWPQPKSSGKVYTKNRIAKTVQTKFDAATLHENRELAAETQMYDDGTGTTQVWRIDNFDLVPVDKTYIGQFYTGDCYLILYTYKAGGKERHIIYYWQGEKSTADERGTSALKAIELDDKFGGEPVQVRVVEGKEPTHFMSIFDGKMIIFQGEKSESDWKSEGSNNLGRRHPDEYMLHVRGTSTLNTKAIEVPLDATSLNSNDVFVVFKKTAVFIWAGKGCTGDEREMAKNIAKMSPREPASVFEGQEKEAFWTAIGGKKPYMSDPRLQEEEPDNPPRLFQLSNASGSFTAEEIPDFIQDDLVEDDCMMLDCWDSIYLWIGKNANDIEKKSAVTLALDYLKADPAGRDEKTPIIRIKQGFEPPTFTGFFGSWDRDQWSKGLTYEQLSQQLGEGNQEIIIQNATQNGGGDFSDQIKFKLEQLQVAPDELPDGVDRTAREKHLSDDDFQAVFKMSYAEFLSKPVWKQQNMKKQARLF